jgi:hypothetical protein
MLVIASVPVMVVVVVVAALVFLMRVIPAMLRRRVRFRVTGGMVSVHGGGWVDIPQAVAIGASPRKYRAS